MSAIIGIDPGLAEAGWGIIEKMDNKVKLLSYGCIKTDASLAHAKRLLSIYKEMKALLKKWKPVRGAAESIYFSRNAKSAIKVAEARGVFCMALAEAGVEVYEYPPNAIKLAVTGVAGADKRQVQEMVRIILALPEIPRPDHAADALGAAICCAANVQND